MMRNIDEVSDALSSSCVLYNKDMGLTMRMLSGGHIVMSPPITPADPESAALLNFDPSCWEVCEVPNSGHNRL